MIKMRNSWDDVGSSLNTLRGNDVLSSSQHSITEDKTSRYDFGISTDRSISAPPPSGMGFDMLRGLEETSTWGNNDEAFNVRNMHLHGGPENVQKHSTFSESNAASHLINFNNARGKNVHGDAISRPKSAAPQLNPNSCPDRPTHRLFPSQNEKQKPAESPSDSLFQNFDVMKIGARRSASTGLIGGNQSSSSSSAMDALGLVHEFPSNRKPQTFMDLIQEDVLPKEPTPPEFSSRTKEPEVLDAVNGSSSHGYSAQPNGIHGPTMGSIQSVPVNNYSNRDYGQNSHQNYDHMQQNQIQNGSHRGMETTRAPHSQQHQNHMYQQHPHISPIQHQQAQQNVFEQAQSAQYYNTMQRDNIPVHTQNPSMHPHPQVVQSNANINPSVQYVNPSFGGYTTVQYHQAPPAQHYGHTMNSVPIHSHDPIMNSRLQPPQYITAVPIQGGMQTSNGTFIYFHQPSDMQRQAHPQPITILDQNGRPATISVSPNTLQNIPSSPQNTGRTHNIKSPVGNRNGDKVNRKSRGSHGKKGSSGSSLDASRHSLSSGTLSLLDEYRSSKDRSWTANDVKGHIVEFCQDQNGSRFVQQRLEIAEEAEMALITSEILPSVHTLRNDVFGNYVVQKLFDHGNHEIRSTLKEGLRGQMLSLSSQMYGCRVVQKAIEKVEDDDLIDLLSEFHDTTLNCIHDQNGNHVIQKIIQVVSSRSKTYQAENKGKAIEFSKHLRFVLDCVVDNIVSLSCHPFGCRVLQRLLEHCIESQKSEALDCIQGYLRTLLDDQYGNYVIQHVLQFGRKSDRDIVLQIVIENGILGLSRQKFASNVIEKLLKYGNGNHRKRIVREMLNVVNDSTVQNGQCSIALLMVRDAYANYVVQTTLDVVPDSEEKELLVQELRNNSTQLRNYTFAKHIITKLEEADNNIRRLS